MTHIDQSHGYDEDPARTDRGEAASGEAREYHGSASTAVQSRRVGSGAERSEDAGEEKCGRVNDDGEDLSNASWGELARQAAEDVRERLGRVSSLRLKDRDRDRIEKRVRDTVNSALRVPEGRPAELGEGIAKLRAAHPDATPTELAWLRTRERARRAAAAGAATTIPALIPGIGTAMAALGVVADWHFVAEQQRDLVLEVAALYGVELDDPTREVRGMFLASTGVAFGAARAGDAAARTASHHVARRWLSRLVPGVGAAISGGLNYVSTLAMGRAAIARFAGEQGIEVRGLVPATINPALPRLRQAVVSLVHAASLGDGATPVFTREQREIIEHLSSAEREELLDLAVLGAAAHDGVSADEENVLTQLARELGFGPAELDEARRGADEGLTRVRARFSRLAGRAGRGGADAARSLWRRAKRLSRRGGDGA